MKTFKVTVDGQTYTVKVEELTEKTGSETTNTAEREKSPVNRSDSTTTKAKEAAAVKDKPAVEEKKEEASAPPVEGGVSVKAPMPGSVIEVKVKEGDRVEEGDVLLVLEAMKMENELTASQGGTVAQILVKKGDTVNSGDPLIILS